jgi:hypothetical protein
MLVKQMRDIIDRIVSEANCSETKSARPKVQTCNALDKESTYEEKISFNAKQMHGT